MAAGERRDWGVLAPLIEVDKQVYKNLSSLIVEEVARLEADCPGIIRASAIPHKWELDQNMSSIMLRIEHRSGVVRRVYSSCPVEDEEHRSSLRFLLEETVNSYQYPFIR